MDRQSDFEKYRKEFHDLSAHWKVAYRTWTLWWGSTPGGIRIPQECEGVFNAIARKAVTKLPCSGVPSDLEPWRRWLDYMRDRNWGFHVTGHAPCTLFEWDAGVKDGKSLSKVQSERGYKPGIFRRTKTGKLRRLTARELEGKNSEDLKDCFEWIYDGAIDHVFESSARLCEDLAASAFELEATGDGASPRRGYRAEVKRWMKDEEIKTIPDAAQRLHVGFDTLKSIMSSRGKRRYGNDTLQAVLKTIYGPTRR